MSAAGESRRPSVLLRRFSADRLSVPDDAPVTLAQILEALGPEGAALAIIVLALPNFLPLPGISLLVGVPLMLLWAQLAMARREPMLPPLIGSRALPAGVLRRLIARGTPAIERAERLLQRRVEMLATGVPARAAALVAFGLAVIVTLPIPLANGAPAAAMILIALGLLMRDGLCVAVGLAATALAVFFAGSLLAGLVA